MTKKARRAAKAQVSLQPTPPVAENTIDRGDVVTELVRPDGRVLTVALVLRGLGAQRAPQAVISIWRPVRGVLLPGGFAVAVLPREIGPVVDGFNEIAWRLVGSDEPDAESDSGVTP